MLVINKNRKGPICSHKRYYSTEIECYLSQDPIRLAGNNLIFYGYVYE